MERESERVLLVAEEVEVEVVSIEPGLERNTCSSGIRDKDIKRFSSVPFEVKRKIR